MVSECRDCTHVIFRGQQIRTQRSCTLESTLKTSQGQELQLAMKDASYSRLGTMNGFNALSRGEDIPEIFTLPALTSKVLNVFSSNNPRCRLGER